MKKGFTLVEMLAVVILIGILSIFIISKVKSSINDSKEAVSFASTEKLINIMEEYYFEQKMSASFKGCTFDFQTRITNCTGLSFTGELPTSGILSINSDGEIEGNIVFYDKYNYEVKNSIVINDIYGDNIRQYIDIGKEYKFIANNKEQLFKVEQTGYYMIEAWGAQGGNHDSTYIGGFGGYSRGYAYLIKDQILYVNIGGKGTDTNQAKPTGGYNGGGNGYTNNHYIYVGAGGGATHIALKSGLLKDLEESKDDILIVASGGSGAFYSNEFSKSGNSGGGIIGGYYNDITLAGTQKSGFQFGQASDTTTSFQTNVTYSGGGGGYYGGFSRNNGNAGGGSGYIGNKKLKDKIMYCYECKESEAETTKTVSVKESSLQPISNTPKIGDGHVLIKYVGNKIP